MPQIFKENSSYYLIGFQSNNRTADGRWMQHHWWGILGLIGWAYLVASLLYLALSRHRDFLVACVALLVNFVAQFHPGLFVEISVLRFFKNRSHVGRNRVGPGVAVITGVVAVHVTEISDEGRAWIDRQKDFFENRI